MTLPLTTGELRVGDTVTLYGRHEHVHAVRPIEDTDARMILLAQPDTEPHPLDWWPETSVLREATDHTTPKDTTT